MSDLKFWKSQDKELLLNVEPWFKVWREAVELPDGQIVPDFYTFSMPNSCVIIAMRSDHRVITLKQYKHGVGKIVTNLPAGFIEEGESPLAGAKRELIEETGYVSESWVDLGHFVRNANRGCGLMHVFLATDVRQVTDPDSGDLEDFDMDFIDFDVLLETVLTDEFRLMGITLSVLLAHNHLQSLVNQ